MHAQDALVNGPPLPENGISQDDVDALLADFDYPAMSGAAAGNRDQAGGSVILLLSLKLILLAFFILFSALS